MEERKEEEGCHHGNGGPVSGTFGSLGINSFAYCSSFQHINHRKVIIILFDYTEMSNNKTVLCYVRPKTHCIYDNNHLQNRIRIFPPDISPPGISVMNPTSIYGPNYFHQSSFHLNKERVSSNVRVVHISVWVSFAIILRLRYTMKISFICPASS